MNEPKFWRLRAGSKSCTNQSPPPAMNQAVTWSTYPNKCYQCGLSFKSILDLKEHFRSAHGEFHGFRCSDCEIMVPTFHTFIEHVREHRPELIEYCPICDIKTNDPNHINSHPESFSEPTLHVAPSTSDDAKAQTTPNPVRDLSRFFGPRVRDTVGINSWKEYPWVCQFCNMNCKDQPTLRTHLKRVHRKCFGFKCTDCSTVTKSYEAFISHVKTHRANLAKKCEHCDFALSEQNHYIIHIQEHILDFQCSTCGDYFHDRAGLRRHKLLYNANELKTQKPFKCDQCKRSFRFNYHLQNHKHIHFDEMPHICQLCSKGFKYKKAFANHERSHSKPCFDPSTSFANRSDYTTQLMLQEPIYATGGAQLQVPIIYGIPPKNVIKQPKDVYAQPKDDFARPKDVFARPKTPVSAQEQPQVTLRYNILMDYADIFLANGKRLPVNENSTKVTEKMVPDS